MTAYAIDGLCVAFVLVFLYQVQLKNPLSDDLFPDSLSMQTTGSIKGILSIVVLLHHLSQKMLGRIVLPIFGGMGYLSVSVLVADLP